ncbi:MAG: metalloregulator ArsR/SmtB family transcription factor [Longicatena sp.]
MEKAYKNEVKIFKALSDEKRWLVLEQLQSGEKCACVLMEQLQISQSALSYHMKILCESQIVVSRQEGKWTHYRISEEGSLLAMKCLQTITTTNKSKETTCCK